jgi:hypothetical protein
MKEVSNDDFILRLHLTAWGNHRSAAQRRRDCQPQRKKEPVQVACAR